jgi:hypothetical protein
MRPSFLWTLALASGGVVAACGEHSGGGADDPLGTPSAETSAAAPLPCDVDAILERSCRGCHGATPTFGAPMPLVTLADLVAPSHSDPSKKVFERVAERVHAQTRPMPPVPNPPLSSADLDVIDRFVAAGAPAGTSSCSSTGPTEPTPLSCTPDVHLMPASAWAMPQDQDDVYVCYGFDVTSANKRHIVGIAPKIDNRAIVHHLLMFEADESVSSTPTPCDGLNPSWRIVYGWAPGGGNFELPPEAGVPQERTTHYVMQVHYNNVLHRPDQRDSSGFDFCTTDHLRPHDADTMAFGTMRFQLPPRSTTDLSCDTQLPAGVPELHLFAAFPHMHTLGTSIQTRTVPTDGSAGVSLGGQTNWDFQNQVYQPINGLVRGGDTIRTRCVWKNDRDTTVTFGERTADEMCYSFTMYWPRITSSQWSWAAPTALSRCTPTP